jgi:signal transduction histidine kinase
MKKRGSGSWPIFVFFVMVTSFFAVHYLFLERSAPDREEYLKAYLFVVPAILVSGYIFISSLIERKRRQDDMLEHLVREVLHEINLPIATMEANISMIEKSLDDRKTLKRVERLKSASRRLKKLYRELAYNIRREIAPVEVETFSLDELIRERVAWFSDLGRNRIELVLDGFVMDGDRVGTEQVLDNILENAMKYSNPSDDVTVTLRGGTLSIVDRGIGMDENEILRIYERYYQSDRAVQGEGIGLAIVKRYCDDERIPLRIESSPGRGTKVTLDFSKKATDGTTPRVS